MSTIRLEHTGDGAVFRFGQLRLPSGQGLPVSLSYDDWDALAALITDAEEVIELRALFDLQETRMAAATQRWRAEAPEERALILPDLGALLGWLLGQVATLDTLRQDAGSDDRWADLWAEAEARELRP